MKKCLIAGAGGAGAEVLSWALQMNQRSWEIAGFLDSNPRALEGRNLPYRVLGDPLTWTPQTDEVFVAAIGDPRIRMQICERLVARGAKFVSVVHPSVIMGLNVEIGEGCILCPNAVIGPNAKLGRFVFVNQAATIGHDSVTGDGTTISAHCDVTGHVSIGKECFLGSHASILPGKRVGDGATVGAGSAVLKDVAAGTTVMGVPAAVVFRAASRNQETVL